MNGSYDPYPDFSPLYEPTSFSWWLFSIPWKALNWPRDKEYYILNLDKTTLTSAPGFDKKHWPDSSNEWELQREGLNQFYHNKP